MMLSTKLSQTVLIAEPVSTNAVVLIFSMMMPDVFSSPTSFSNTCSLGLFLICFISSGNSLRGQQSELSLRRCCGRPDAPR